MEYVFMCEILISKIATGKTGAQVISFLNLFAWCISEAFLSQTINFMYISNRWRFAVPNFGEGFAQMFKEFFIADR